MPNDKFNSTDSVTAPARNCYSIAPSDTQDLPTIPKAIYVGTSGDLVVVGEGGGTDVAFRNVPTGTILPIRPTGIRATGTTATDIVGLV